jgi:hypothetical protein
MPGVWVFGVATLFRRRHDVATIDRFVVINLSILLWWGQVDVMFVIEAALFVLTILAILAVFGRRLSDHFVIAALGTHAQRGHSEGVQLKQVSKLG